MSLSKSTYHSNKTIENFSFSSEKTITKKACYDFLYEKENHLGNVHVVVSDRKLPVDDGVYDGNGNQTSSTPDGIFDYYEPDVVFAADYYDGVGMVMPGRLFVTEDHRYGAQGSEVDQEIDGTRDRITTYYRQGNLKTMRWDSPDPKASLMPWQSPYAMFDNNPVSFNDPMGDIPWKGQVDDEGHTYYEAEKGDTKATFASQYGLTPEQATQIVGNGPIKQGSLVAGQNVFDVMGTEALKLDLMSKQATNQRIFDHYLYARDHASSKGSYALLTGDYFSNRLAKSTSSWGGTGTVQGSALLKVETGKSIKVSFDLPMHRVSFDGSSDSWALGVESVTDKQTSGLQYKDQLNVQIPYYHPNTGKHNGYYTINTESSNGDYVHDRLSKTFPRYDYIKSLKIESKK